MNLKMIDAVSFWLPIIGGVLLGGIAGNAWYGGNKSLALWVGFSGLICFLLLGAIQIQKGIWRSRSSHAEKDLTTSAQRPWIGLSVEIAGPLRFENGFGVPLKITMSNSSPTPAIGALPYPMIFTREKQPFTAEEIIKRRTATFSTGEGLGFSIFQNKPVTEVNAPSNTLAEIGYAKEIAPFVLVAVKYRSPGGNKVFLTADLYSLVRKNPSGGALVIETANRNVPASELMLIPLGSYAD